MLLFPFVALPQQRKIDSLKMLLQRGQADTLRLMNLNLLSRQYINTGSYDSALYRATEALKLCDDLLSGEEMNAEMSKAIQAKKAIALNEIGAAYHMEGDYVKAMDHYFRSLKVAEDLGDETRIATELGNIGVLYADQEEYDKALEYYFKVLKMAEQTNKGGKLGDKTGMSRYLGNIGAAYHHQSNFTKALEYYQRALSIKRELGDKSGIARYLGNVGLVYKQQASRIGDDSAAFRQALYGKALEHYLLALQAFRELGDKNRMAGFMSNIGSLYTAAPTLSPPTGESRKGYELAEKYLLDALALSKEIESQHEEMDIENNLATLYTITHKFEQALLHFKRSMSIQSTLFNIEKDRQLTRKAMNYEFAKKEAEAKLEQEKKDQVAREELAKRERQRNYFIIGFVIAGLFALFIFRGYREKKRANVIITQQKLEVEEKNRIIEEKNKDILDSIHYAKRIQTSLMPTETSIHKALRRLHKDGSRTGSS